MGIWIDLLMKIADKVITGNLRPLPLFVFPPFSLVIIQYLTPIGESYGPEEDIGKYSFIHHNNDDEIIRIPQPKNGQ